jgi:hypothetical protein
MHKYLYHIYHLWYPYMNFTHYIRTAFSYEKVAAHILRYTTGHHSFIQLACAECKDSLPFSGASSIPHYYILFPVTLLHQLFFHPLSPHLAINFSVYLSILLFPSWALYSAQMPYLTPSLLWTYIVKLWSTAQSALDKTDLWNILSHTIKFFF